MTFQLFLLFFLCVVCRPTILFNININDIFFIFTRFSCFCLFWGPSFSPSIRRTAAIINLSFLNQRSKKALFFSSSLHRVSSSAISRPASGPVACGPMYSSIFFFNDYSKCCFCFSFHGRTVSRGDAQMFIHQSDGPAKFVWVSWYFIC